MKINHIIYAVAATMLAACSNADGPDELATQQVPLTISATIAEAGTRAAINSFNKTSKIGVYVDCATDTYPSNGGSCFTTTDGATFTSSDLFYFDKQEVPVKAYYPYNSTNKRSFFCNEQPQTVIDFLHAEGTANAATGKVNLEFHHLLTKLTFNFSWSEDFDSSVTSNVTYGNIMLSDLISKANFIAPDSIDLSNSTHGTILVTNRLKYAIVIPHDVESFGISVNCEIANQSYTFTGTVPVPSGRLESGKNYIYNVTICKTGLTVSPATAIEKWTVDDHTTDEDETIEANYVSK
jgi:hypothetical protein